MSDRLIAMILEYNEVVAAGHLLHLTINTPTRGISSTIISQLSDNAFQLSTDAIQVLTGYGKMLQEAQDTGDDTLIITANHLRPLVMLPTQIELLNGQLPSSNVV